LKALKKGDFKAAEAMLVAHITRGRDRLLSHIEDSAYGEHAVLPLKLR
jgi:DNA-binding GntR family transcriptional regulator